MTLLENVREYRKKGFSETAAEAHAASEAIMKKISKSGMADHVTFKGGVLMYRLTKNARRATTDLDFDFIRYSIDDSSLVLFIQKLDSVSDGIHIEIVGQIQPFKTFGLSWKKSDSAFERFFLFAYDET
jgi:hypothetical protein